MVGVAYDLSLSVSYIKAATSSTGNPSTPLPCIFPLRDIGSDNVSGLKAEMQLTALSVCSGKTVFICLAHLPFASAVCRPHSHIQRLNDQLFGCAGTYTASIVVMRLG